MKIALIIIAIVYTISPIDLVPGPVDDAILDLAVTGIVLFINTAGSALRKKGINVKKEHLDAVSAAASQAVRTRSYGNRTQQASSMQSAQNGTAGANKTTDTNGHLQEHVNSLKGF